MPLIRDDTCGCDLNGFWIPLARHPHFGGSQSPRGKRDRCLLFDVLSPRPPFSIRASRHRRFSPGSASSPPPKSFVCGGHPSWSSSSSLLNLKIRGFRLAICDTQLRGGNRMPTT